MTNVSCANCKFLEKLEEPIGKYNVQCLNTQHKVGVMVGAGLSSIKSDALLAFSNIGTAETDTTLLFTRPEECICEHYIEASV